MLRVGEISLVLFELCLRDRQIRLRLIDQRLIRPRIDLGADLTFLHLGVVVAVELLNDAGNVGPDNDRELGVDSATCRDGTSDRAPRDGHGRVMDGGPGAQGPPCGNNRSDEE